MLECPTIEIFRQLLRNIVIRLINPSNGPNPIVSIPTNRNGDLFRRYREVPEYWSSFKDACKQHGEARKADQWKFVDATQEMQWIESGNFELGIWDLECHILTASPSILFSSALLGNNLEEIVRMVTGLNQNQGNYAIGWQILD